MEWRRHHDRSENVYARSQASVWIYQPRTGYCPTLYLRFGTGTDAYLADVITNPTEAGGGWYRATVFATAPATASNARIHVTWYGMASNETVYIDDASLLETS